MTSCLTLNQYSCAHLIWGPFLIRRSWICSVLFTPDLPGPGEEAWRGLKIPLWLHVAGTWWQALPGPSSRGPAAALSSEAPGSKSPYLGARVCPVAFLPGGTALCRPPPETLCGHSSRTSSRGGKEGRIILGKAYHWHLPRCPHFPSLCPQPRAPSSALSAGFSIACAFPCVLSFWSRQGRVSGGERPCVRGCSCVSKVLCWRAESLPSAHGNRGMLWRLPPTPKLMLFLCQGDPRKRFVPFPPLSGRALFMRGAGGLP